MSQKSQIVQGFGIITKKSDSLFRGLCCKRSTPQEDGPGPAAVMDEVARGPARTETAVVKNLPQVQGPGLLMVPMFQPFFTPRRHSGTPFDGEARAFRPLPGHIMPPLSQRRQIDFNVASSICLLVPKLQLRDRRTSRTNQSSTPRSGSPTTTQCAADAMSCCPGSTAPRATDGP
jgi:hypothetical protein